MKHMKPPTFQLPDWIESMSPYDIAAINQGGCDSGAYMPAVTYYTARETMAQYGDDVLEFLDMAYDSFLVPDDISWSGLCVHYLSGAVEMWCALNEHLADWENDDEL